MAKKSFKKIGENRGKAEILPSALDMLFDDPEEEKPVKHIEPKQEKKPDKKPSTETKPRANPKSRTSRKSVKITSTDKRSVDDKKVPYSSILRKSLSEEYEDVLKAYRQQVDFEYNKAQFLEDAVIHQIKVLRNKLK